MRSILVPDLDFVAIRIANKSKRLVVTKIAASEHRAARGHDPIDAFVEAVWARQSQAKTGFELGRALP